MRLPYNAQILFNMLKYLFISKCVLSLDLPDNDYRGIPQFENFSVEQPPEGASKLCHIKYDQDYRPNGKILFSDENVALSREEGGVCVMTPPLSDKQSSSICFMNAPFYDSFIASRTSVELSFQGETFTSSGMPVYNQLHLPFRIGLLNHDGLVLHASTAVLDGKCYLFLAPSGTGKSTHTSLWVKHLGAHKINDDKPVARFIDGKLHASGNPWSGSTECYVNETVPVAGLCMLSQGPKNVIRRCDPLEAFTYLTRQLPLLHFEDSLYNKSIELLSRISKEIPVFHLSCLPDREAAEVSYSAMFTE